ncbi:Hypothetical_protein [Hexamita inflata]|uniref:Hypothetical_protein n=1 Tax=Hexamita inflata TaxID=28002 RepID=A0AA86PTV2_9EUKA|nr:Hypothetical protein HINF_LOCUS22017 [Hexamita inflata]CAI9940817.1 Hypothetical protein HINF_LOCUS28462 [Hexamita inflata]
MQDEFLQALRSTLNIPSLASYDNQKSIIVSAIKRLPYKQQEQVWYDLSFLLNMRVADVQRHFEREYCQTMFKYQDQLYESFSTQWDSSANNPEPTQNSQIRVLKVPVGDKKIDKQLVVTHHKFTQEEIMMIRQLCMNSDLSEEAKLDMIKRQLEFRKQICQFTRLLQKKDK